MLLFRYVSYNETKDSKESLFYLKKKIFIKQRKHNRTHTAQKIVSTKPINNQIKKK